MAELDPQNTHVEETPAVAEEAIVIPANRPRKVYAGMWGPVEIGVLAAGVLAVVMSMVVYFFWVVPSNLELARNRAEADRLEVELISANSKYGETMTTQERVEKLVGSIDDFETRFLPVQTYGQAALYERLNTLIHSFGLENTTGPDYTPLESINLDRPSEQNDEDKGRAKFKSLYPGVYVSTTVEGTYHNLRRFIREIETSREFVVISAVELAPSETQKTETDGAAPDAAAPQQINQISGPVPGGKQLMRPPAGTGGFQQAPPQGNQLQRNDERSKTHGETVALHIEMAAYFRRPSSPRMSAPTEQ